MPSPRTPCLTETELARFAAGRLSGAERRRVEAHLDECATCRSLVAESVAVTEEHYVAARTTRSPDSVSAGSTLPSADDAGPARPVRVRVAQERELLRGTVVGRYVIVKKIGRGGMGTVYLAFDGELERRVAIKIIRRGRSFEAATLEMRTRLLREAQAMAKVTHPNVVTVFDVGTRDDEVFIAMEYVAGTTLREWRGKGETSAAEIVQAYVQAGHGLEAAHGAGILHRDFKADNVLVDGGGRVRVVDFGLARLADRSNAATEDEVEIPGLRRGRPNALLSPLTADGALLGTPAYMAPELLRGEPADARTDQFAFAVALWEALYEELPFAGSDISELRAAVLRGEPSEPRDRRRVPRAVHRVLERGIALRPDDRYASMGDLLAALGAAMKRRRRWLAWSAAGVGTLALVATGVRFHSPHGTACGDAASEISTAWGAPQRAAVREAFGQRGGARGPELAARVDRLLTAYADRWTTMRTESCEATRVRGVQSDEALDLRTACLDQRRAELGAMTGLLAKADAKLVAVAPDAVRSLSSVAVCADVAALRAPFAMPHDPAARAVVRDLRARAANARALLRARRIDEGLAAIGPILEGAEASHNRQLQGVARLLLGFNQSQRGKLEEARRTLMAASADSLATGDDSAAASALVALVGISGRELERFDEAEAFAVEAGALIDRMGARAIPGRWILTRARSHVSAARRDHKEQFALVQEAVSELDDDRDVTPQDRIHLDSDLGDLEASAGHLHAAITRYRRAIETYVSVAGEIEGNLVIPLYNLVDMEIDLSDGSALADARRLLGKIDQGDEVHPDARLRAACASVLRGDTSEGLVEARAALSEMAATHGADSSAMADAEVTWSATAIRRSLPEEALRATEHAASCPKAPAQARQLGRAIHAIALARTGKARAALAEGLIALSDEEKTPDVVNGFESFSLIPRLLAVGEGALGVGDGARALEALERATAIAETSESRPELNADVHLGLARAVVATKGDLRRAASLASRAAGEYELLHLGEPEKVARELATRFGPSTSSRP